MPGARLVSSLSNIYRLGVKELRSLTADKVLLVLIVWAFSSSSRPTSSATWSPGATPRSSSTSTRRS